MASHYIWDRYCFLDRFLAGNSIISDVSTAVFLVVACELHRHASRLLMSERIILRGRGRKRLAIIYQKWRLKAISKKSMRGGGIFGTSGGLFKSFQKKNMVPVPGTFCKVTRLTRIFQKFVELWPMTHWRNIFIIPS